MARPEQRFTPRRPGCGIDRRAAMAMLGAACLPSSLRAQAYPARPIRLIVPYAAGTTTDLLARQVGDGLGEVIGQKLVIDNRPGAGGRVGTVAAARAEPDGYTLLFGTGQTHAVNVSLFPDLGYDPISDFAPIARIASQPLVLAVHSGLGVQSVAELVALAKSRPGQLSYASTGTGASPHLAGATFAVAAGIDILHVPYNNAQLFPDLLTGRGSMILYPYPPLKGYIDSKQLTPLATTGERRSPWLPDTPTMIEAGYPTFTFAPWYAFFAPAKTPVPNVKTISAALQRVLADPHFNALLDEAGTDVAFGGPDVLAAFTASEIERFRPIVAASGARGN